MNSSEEIPEGTMRGLLAGTFAPDGSDVPVVNLVPDAVADYRSYRGVRRTRILGGSVASVAVVGITAAVVGLGPSGHSGSGGNGGGGTSVAPLASSSALNVKPAPVGNVNLPHMPELDCHGTWPSSTLGSNQEQQKADCVATLTALRRMLSGATVLPTRSANSALAALKRGARISEVAEHGPYGVPNPDIAAAYTELMNDPASKDGLNGQGMFTVTSADGGQTDVYVQFQSSGQGTPDRCVGGKTTAGTPVPCQSMELPDGTRAEAWSGPSENLWSIYAFNADGSAYLLEFERTAASVPDNILLLGGDTNVAIDWTTGAVRRQAAAAQDPYASATSTPGPSLTNLMQQPEYAHFVADLRAHKVGRL